MQIKYGIPYKGSKSKIAPQIISFLPSGKRLVDLFGGGFAITHCAMYSGKWQNFLYNDIDNLIVELVKKAINGDYNYNKFTPKWISREDFEKLKNKDGYIKYIWSFGNNGRNYLFGRDIEHIKKAAHQAVVFDDLTDLQVYFPDFKGFEEKNDIKKRRLEFKTFINKNKKRLDLQQLQQLERLQQLELTNISYLDYEYNDGDVVYCDIPYENTDDYGEKFDHEEFYDWAKSRTFPVYFSSYPIEGWSPVFEIEKLQTLSATNNSKIVTECIYCNKKVDKKRLLHKQISLFSEV